MYRNPSTVRVSAFVVDIVDGSPLTGALVTVLAQHGKDQLIVGQLPSDDAGYVSFELPLEGTLPSADRLTIRAQGDDTSSEDVSAVLRDPGNPLCVSLRANSGLVLRSAKGACRSVRHSVSAHDLRLSPGSFASNPNMQIGGPGCEHFLHSHAATHTFRLRQVLRDLEDSKSGEPHSLSAIGEGDSLEYLHGWVQEYRVDWIPVGHALGRVLYSLPLAPCESVNVAVLDWNREAWGAREEDTTLQEKIYQEIYQERTIEETMDATIEETVSGGGGHVGVQVSALWGLIDLGGAGGGGLSYEDRREIDSTTVQDLSDTIEQTGSSIRRQHSTVIVQASEQEKEVLTTRTVANHNHCHALTVLYYEILRHFRVRTSWAGERRVILIRHPLLRFSENRMRVFCNRGLLEPALLRPDLRPCFDVLERVLFGELTDSRGGQQATGDTSSAGGGLTLLTSAGGARRLHLNVSDGRALITTEGEPALDTETAIRELHVTIWTDSLSMTCRAYFGLEPINAPSFERELDIANIAHVTRSQGGESERTISTRGLTEEERVAALQNFGPGGARVHFALENVPPLRVNDLQRAYLRLEQSERRGADHRLELAGMRVQYLVHGDEYMRTLLDSHAPDVSMSALGSAEYEIEAGDMLTRLPQGRSYRRVIWNLEGPTSRPDRPSPEEIEAGTSSSSDNACISRLLQHLDCHSAYYNRVIWLGQDPQQRAMELARYWSPDAEGSMLDYIENRPIAVLGDYVAFPVRRSRIDDSPQIETSVKPREVVVTLPTPGTFAEAKLGHCVACEQKDDTLFWDWTESPCPSAPEISGIEPGEHGEMEIPSATPMPGSVFNIVNQGPASDSSLNAANLAALASIAESNTALSDAISLLQAIIEEGAGEPPDDENDEEGKEEGGGGTKPETMADDDSSGDDVEGDGGKPVAADTGELQASPLSALLERLRSVTAPLPPAQEIWSMLNVVNAARRKGLIDEEQSRDLTVRLLEGVLSRVTGSNR